MKLMGRNEEAAREEVTETARRETTEAAGHTRSE